MILLKKMDLILIGILIAIGAIMLFSMKLIEKLSSTGNTYAQVFYQDELILMIDLDTFEYKIYDTVFAGQVDANRASEGVFYVPGSVTTDMTGLYEEDDYARENHIVGIKLLVENGKISVAYQESPKDICELQSPTNSSLNPLVCLPNQLIINISTTIPSGTFVPDAVMR